MSRLISEAGSDRFASEIVFYSTNNRTNNNIISNWTGVDESKLKDAFAQRMRERHPVPMSSSVDLKADDILAFTRWLAFTPNDKSYVIEYFRGAFEADPNNLGAFLLWLLPGNVSYEGSPIKFVEGVYPVTDIAQRLEQAEANGFNWTPHHALAVSRFWEFLHNEPPAPQQPTP